MLNAPSNDLAFVSFVRLLTRTGCVVFSAFSPCMIGFHLVSFIPPFPTNFFFLSRLLRPAFLALKSRTTYLLIFSSTSRLFWSGRVLRCVASETKGGAFLLLFFLYPFYPFNLLPFPPSSACYQREPRACSRYRFFQSPLPVLFLSLHILFTTFYPFHASLIEK